VEAKAGYTEITSASRMAGPLFPAQIRAICQEHEEGQVPGRISTAHSHLWVQKYALKKKNLESYSSFEMKWNSDDRLVFLPLEDCNMEQNFYYFLAI
jgi:hypothetical protein